jgi:hypothetical protein
MSAAVFDISTGRCILQAEPSPRELIDRRVRQALRGYPPSLIGLAIDQGHRRFGWGHRSPDDAADDAITWARRQLMLERQRPEPA